MTTPEQDQQTLLNSLSSWGLAAGEKVEIGLKAAREMTLAQIAAMIDYLKGYGIDVQGVQQNIVRVASGGLDQGQSDLDQQLAKLGDVEIKMGAMPTAAMPAAMAVGYVLRSAALAGAALVAYAFTRKPGEIGTAAKDVLDSSKLPLLLILLALIALYLILRKAF